MIRTPVSIPLNSHPTHPSREAASEILADTISSTKPRQITPAFILEQTAAMFGLAALGTPISLSMIVAAVAYLAIKGQDLGLAAEQIIQGLYDSFVILAVPLFIIAANVMNSGSITTRLNDF